MFLIVLLYIVFQLCLFAKSNTRLCKKTTFLPIKDPIICFGGVFLGGDPCEEDILITGIVQYNGWPF